MNGVLNFSNLFSSANARSLAAPVFIILILAMLVLPLPPFALDMLFTFNIALSIMVLLVSLSTRKALEFAAFPTVLLLSTLLRLSLNVASTRVVLLEAPPLARALFRHTELGDEIPATLYAAVAEVLAYVFQLRHYQQVGGAYPDAPTALPVPPELDPLQAVTGANA